MPPGPVGSKPSVFSTLGSFLSSNAKTIDKGVGTTLKLQKAAKDLPGALKDLQTKGFTKATGDAWEKARSKASNPGGTLDALGKYKLARGGYDAVTGWMKAPGEIGTASQSIRNAVRTGSQEDVSRAVQDGAKAAKTTLGAAKDTFTTAQSAHKLATTYRAASDAFKAAAPNASPALARAAGRAAAKSVYEGAARGAVKEAVEAGVKKALPGAAASVARATGEASRTAARSVLKTAGREAAEAAVKAGVKAGAGTLAKAGGRFVPGVNIALAALDTANAAATWADPKAGLGKKIGNSVTALGSIAAATNIPVVSQVGAGVSAVSGFVTSFFK